MHADCLEHWVIRKGFCPICKTDMKIFGIPRRTRNEARVEFQVVEIPPIVIQPAEFQEQVEIE